MAPASQRRVCRGALHGVTVDVQNGAKRSDPRQKGPHDCGQQSGALSARSWEPSVPCPGSQPVVAIRLHLCALAETINGLYKAELIHRRSWRSFEEVEFATLGWVDWFNHRRLMGPIGNIPAGGSRPTLQGLAGASSAGGVT